jgi:diguanylate cyclase (GGDEF)-like protein
LLDDEGCIGVLAVSAPGADAFTDEDERRLRLVAGIVAPRLEMVRLRRLTVTDPLTGLWNRRALDDLVPSKGRDDEPLSVAAIDIDRFKVINDRFGHGVGDDVLRAVAVALSLAVRDSDAVVRVGGEEIVLVLRGASLELAATVAERGRGAVEALSVIDDGGVTVSIGVAEQRPGEAREDVLARADAALYRAKQSGRNRVERDDPLHWAVASKGKPYRTVVVEGYEVLVGRAAEDNDHLTFHVASPHDLWLHVAGGTPGSHVVVRNPDKTEVPRAVVEQAAAFAGWYSKARGAPRVEVHYCRASDVSKPRGAPAGLVELAKWKSVKVAPAAVPGEG